jgi:hypothetical protein
MVIPGTSLTAAVCFVPALTLSTTLVAALEICHHCTAWQDLRASNGLKTIYQRLPLVPSWQCRYGKALLCQVMLQTSHYYKAETETLPDIACYCASTCLSCFSVPLPGSSQGSAIIKCCRPIFNFTASPEVLSSHGGQAEDRCIELDPYLYSKDRVLFAASF